VALRIINLDSAYVPKSVCLCSVSLLAPSGKIYILYKYDNGYLVSVLIIACKTGTQTSNMDTT
jgi:hypothetical protein